MDEHPNVNVKYIEGKPAELGVYENGLRVHQIKLALYVKKADATVEDLHQLLDAVGFLRDGSSLEQTLNIDELAKQYPDVFSTPTAISKSPIVDTNDKKEDAKDEPKEADVVIKRDALVAAATTTATTTTTTSTTTTQYLRSKQMNEIDSKQQQQQQIEEPPIQESSFLNSLFQTNIHNMNDGDADDDDTTNNNHHYASFNHIVMMLSVILLSYYCIQRRRRQKIKNSE
mmetsp:Transcript_11355/g.32613  ORF Transcript_11355/g.32613 Transcript_11355/m.32613 type:complete len:229 (-) Transcript_11355:142-828(-)